MESTLRLFKAVPIEYKRKKTDKDLMVKTIKRGFIFSPEVIYNYPDADRLIELVEKNIGITAQQLNSSFHKSWTKIKEASIEQLVLEQMIHYLTTYGFEALGIYNEESVYIPNEKLEIPEVTEDIRLTLIRGLTKDELKTKLITLLSTGIALKQNTIDDVLDIATFVEFHENDIENVKNKEVKAALYDYLNLLPENPVEFLRFIVYKSTEKTLLIKNHSLIGEIKEHKNISIVKLFSKYEKEYGLNRLAEIFYRFKPIFLAFRTNKQLKIDINRIRRLAVKHHKALPEDYLNTVTAKLSRNERITKVKLEQELDKVNIFRKIRLAYALKFRSKDTKSILYRLRNGKGYATEFNFSNKEPARRILKIVLDSISKSISKNVKGKKIFMPEHMMYTLPATEKQFTGNFPSGSYVSIPRDMIFGISWKNYKGRIDLDLSVISATEKIGWDSRYRSEDGDILFSGDVVDAKGANGATELFYVKRQKKEALILFVNYFNYEENKDVPFKIIVAKEEPTSFKQNYMIDPNNLLSVAESTINQRQKILGLLVTTLKECRFYFTETYLGNSITSGNSDFAENSRQYLFDFYEDTINLRDVLENAGAKIVDEKEKSDIDLSPEELQKDTILNLLHVEK